MRFTNSQEWLDRDHARMAREDEQDRIDRVGDPDARATAMADPRYIAAAELCGSVSVECERHKDLRNFLLHIADHCKLRTQGGQYPLGGEAQQSVIMQVLKSLQGHIEAAKKSVEEHEARQKEFVTKRNELLKRIMEGK